MRMHKSLDNKENKKRESSAAYTSHYKIQRDSPVSNLKKASIGKTGITQQESCSMVYQHRRYRQHLQPASTQYSQVTHRNKA